MSLGLSTFTHEDTPNLQGLRNLTTIGEDAFNEAVGTPNLQGLTNLTTIGNGAMMRDGHAQPAGAPEPHRHRGRRL